jgi:hypothetical protein
MPSPRSFTIAYSGISRVIQSEVHIAEAFDPKTTKQHPVHKKYNAIWDTGATGSVITKKVVDDCGLKPIGMVNVSTAGGVTACEVYLVNILLTNGVGIKFVKVTQAVMHDGCDVLIGMDVITVGDFAITNKDGKTVASFRTPSSECIDFVNNDSASSQPAHSDKISRNSPCPCGSNKKYKYCCGK